MDTRAFDIGMSGQVMPDLLSYLDVTLLVGFVSIALGSLLGALITWANLGGPAPLRWLVVGYVYVMRCTPSLRSSRLRCSLAHTSRRYFVQRIPLSRADSMRPR